MKTDSKYRQWAFIIRRGFLAVSTRPAVLLVLMGGIFLYGLLYNYMYAPNKVTDMPVAVVDCSHSQLSRNYIRWLEATPQMEGGVRLGRRFPGGTGMDEGGTGAGHCVPAPRL